MVTKHLRWLTVVAPIVFVMVVELVNFFLFRPWIGASSPLSMLPLLILLIAGVIPFSFWVFATIDRQQDQLARAADELERRLQELAAAHDLVIRRNRELAAVNRAIGTVSSTIDLQDVLQNIADAARDLVSSKYAALGVVNEQGAITHFITSGISREEREAIGPLPQGHGLIGALIREGKPLRIPDISKDPRSHGFPPNHPPMKSLLGVPIIFNGKAVGDLYLTDKVGDTEFSLDDQEMLTLVANHAAVAIENAELYEQVRTARDRLQVWNEALEEKVAERTREIERYSKELTTRVLQAQEEERKRISRELHDDTAQSLSTLMINLDLIEPRIPAGDTALLAAFERVRGLTKHTLDAVRALSHALRPTILDDFGLAAALNWYRDELTATFGLDVEVQTNLSSIDRLPPELELALFRIAQEALTNSAKYSGASLACVTLEISDGRIMLQIRDNGKGFDPTRPAPPTRAGGIGLYSMRERADLIGADFTITSSPDRGTRITVVTPLLEVETVPATTSA